MYIPNTCYMYIPYIGTYQGCCDYRIKIMITITITFPFAACSHVNCFTQCDYS